MSSPAEPDLTHDERLALARAVREFNGGLYFECHETLERVWLGLRTPARNFFQGLIQVSVGFHHLGRGNRAGALRTFGRARRRLEAYPERYLSFDVGAERARLQALEAALAGEGVEGPERHPSWCFGDLSTPDQGPPPPR